MLIQQFREQSEDRILTRTDHHEVPPRVSYAMTTFGQSLAMAIFHLCAWEDADRPKIQFMRRRRTTIAAEPESDLP